ncbi:MAG: phosphodiester glycosidase family protein [Mogibacterium sp.]|nr:phosphodiester glycosidase family protein [Mogibacterium sp.]
MERIRSTKRWLAPAVLLLVLILAFACFTFDADAVSETSSKSFKLMDGVTETTAYVTDSGKENIRVHILRVQNGANASIVSTYKGYYKKGSTAAKRAKKASSLDWGYENLKTQAAAYNSIADPAGTVIAASNGDFYSGEGIPAGKFVMEGNVINASNSEPFFAVLKDGSVTIRTGSESISDVQEAIAGSVMLVDGGKVAVEKDSKREPRQGIGVCSDGTVVIINADGRETSTAGATLYDFAMIFKQQGCVRAINFDGGGSATFLTKRSGDSKLVYRNIPGDGFERNVSSSLLVVKNKAASDKTITGSSYVSMKKSNTVLKKVSGKYTYKINGKKQTGFFRINGKSYLFNKNGKGMTKKIKIGDVTYSFKNGELKSASDKNAGTVHIGYCGSASGGQNLLYAYQKGNDRLKIGLNPLYNKKNSGKMMNWNAEKANTTAIPWYSMRSDIKKIYIGDGVTSIGDRFEYVATDKIFDGSKAPTSKLTTVRLPSSLKTIGKYAFYNKPALKNVVIPAKVTSVGYKAFGYAGKGYVQFKGSKPPKFGGKVFDKAKFTKAYVKNTSAWKKAVKANRFKKNGFKKTVSYK